jgi:hypothetical protein
MKFNVLIKNSIFILLLLYCVIATTYSQTLEKMAEEVANMNIFLEHRINKKNIYQGESFIDDYYLIVSNGIALKDMKLLSLPSFNLLKSKEISIGNLSYYDTIIDGISFRKALLHRYILTAANEGTYTIEPIIFETNINIPIDNRYKNQYIKEAPDGYYPYKYILKSNVTTLKINQLPFNNNKHTNKNDVNPVFVGDFEIDYSINKVTAKKNERIQMIVTISGIGDLSIPFAPTLDKTDGLKSNIYKTLDSVNVIRNEIVSKKIFEIDLFATEPKEYIIHPIEILCFSPTQKQYYTIKTDAIPVFFMEDNKLIEKDNNTNYIFLISIFIIVGLVALIWLI